jgi:predicted alpha/beta-fold hydrolase
MILDVPEFVPRAPWWNGDLQTLRNYFVGAGSLDLAPGERLLLPLGDGDRLAGSWHRPPVEMGRPLVVLVHGLSGCEDSFYIRRSAAHLLAAGWPVLRLNLRGAGPARAFCRGHYHAGKTEDLRAALTALPTAAAASGIVLVGYSLGGNVVLKLLGEGAPGNVRAGASISAPIDLAAAAIGIMRRRNFLYHRHILAGIKREATAPGAALTDGERAAIAGARTLAEFDDVFTARRHGFAGVDDYYARASAARLLGAIAVPTLVIHALDDPWIPAASYAAVAWRDNPRLVPLLPRRGGHVGFLGADRERSWHDLCLLRFLAPLSGAEPGAG